MNAKLIIATRNSPLALKQTEWVKDLLLDYDPDLNIELLAMTTQADQRLDVSLEKIGGKGLFVKELELALLEGRADIAVHAMKDVPMFFPEGLEVPVILKREEARDVLVSNQYLHYKDLPSGAWVGTSSLRRTSQLRSLRPGLSLKNLRGNVNTRLNRLDRGDFAAIILAAAGLKRMGFAGRIQSYFDLDECLPAAGQGALGIECRTSDDAVKTLIAPLNDPHTNLCVTAERALCTKLEGGCSTPIGAYACIKNNQIYLRGMVASRDGSKIIRTEQHGEFKMAEQIGLQAADNLIKMDAEAILRDG